MSSPPITATLLVCETTRATARWHGKQIEVSTSLVPDAEVGDEVLVQHGFAIRRLTEASGGEPREVEPPPGDASVDL